MHIFLINLDSRPDRRAFMEAQLDGLGLAAERVSGVRPDEVDGALLRRQEARRPGPYLTAPELACAAGHLRAWRRMLDLSLPHALFLEDDSKLSALLPGFLDEVAPALPRLDVVRLETRLQRATLGAVTHRLPRSGVHLRRPLSELWGLAGYILSAECARRIMDDPQFFDAAIDHQFFDPTSPLFSRIDSRQCVPGLCTPALDDELIAKSDIERERRQRFDEEKKTHPTAERPKRTFAGKLKRETLRVVRQAKGAALDAAGFALATRINMVVPFDSGEQP